MIIHFPTVPKAGELQQRLESCGVALNLTKEATLRFSVEAPRWMGATRKIHSLAWSCDVGITTHVERGWFFETIMMEARGEGARIIRFSDGLARLLE